MSEKKPEHTLHMGDSCVWCELGDQRNPRAAIVVGPQKPRPDGYLDLAILYKDHLQLHHKVAVPHVSDPKWETRSEEWRASHGAWDYAESHKTYRKQVEFLKAELSKLQDAVAALSRRK